MKKSEFISFRTDQATKDILSQIASERKWSVSLLVEDIVQTWLNSRQEAAENKKES